MATTNSRRLDRKKFLGDPVLVVTIVILVVFLALFILYPLAMLLVDSVYEQTTGITVSVFGRVLGMNRFRTAFSNTIVLGLIVGFGSTLLGLLFAYVDVYVHVRSRVIKSSLTW